MRSQMAEAYYNHLTGTNNAQSAGTLADEGRTPDSLVTTVMNEDGIDVSTQTSTRVTQQMIEAADIVVLFPTSYTPDYILSSARSIEKWNVPDPYYNDSSGIAYMRHIRDDIKARVRTLAKNQTSID